MTRDAKAGYYDAGGIEVLDIIKAKLTREQYHGYLLGNALKYGCRLNFKHAEDGGARDVEKASNYMGWLAESMREAPPVKVGDIDAALNNRPPVVCLCGSSSLKEHFISVAADLTLKGYIVLMPHVFAHADGVQLDDGEKGALDVLHLAKIDMADCVRVIYADGRVVESTQKEITYAEELGKPVKYITVPVSSLPEL